MANFGEILQRHTAWTGIVPTNGERNEIVYGLVRFISRGLPFTIHRQGGEW